MPSTTGDNNASQPRTRQAKGSVNIKHANGKHKPEIEASSQRETTQPRADLTEAKRLFKLGYQLCELQPHTKRPVGIGWNGHPITKFNPNATGYGVILHLNGLCSIDPDDREKTRIAFQALGFDLDTLMDAGVRTCSTRPGSGGRSTFRLPEDSPLCWLKFSGESGTWFELRAASVNLQDVLPGTVYQTKDGTWCTQTYAGEKRLDDAPLITDIKNKEVKRFLEMWERMSNDIEFRHEQQRVVGKALGEAPHLDVSAGEALAFKSSWRGRYNDWAQEHGALERLLKAHGYTKVGDRWSAPNATGMPGIRKIPGKEDLWQSDHGSDALFGTFDPWTGYVVLEHGGDLLEAEAAAKGFLKRSAKEVFTAEPWEGKDKKPTWDGKGVAPPPADATRPIDFPEPFPGVMEEVIEAALGTAMKPQPNMTVAGTLVAMASCVPGRYHLKDGLRLNLYALLIGETGCGKEHVRKVANALAHKGGADVIGRPASGAGLEDALQDQQGMLCTIDEIAHYLEAMNSPNSASYFSDYAAVLLSLFSASGDGHKTRVRAQAKGTPKSRKLRNPCLNLLGLSTPEKLGKAVGIANIADGLLGRLLFAFGDNAVTARIVDEAFTLPDCVGMFAPRVRFDDGTDDDADEKPREDMDDDADEKPKRDIVIEYTGQADKMRSTLLSRFEESKNKAGTPFSRGVLTRSYEKCMRVAGVLAVWENSKKPRIGTRHLEWAEKFVKASDSAVLHFCGEYMHEGKVQANAARVLKLLERALCKEFTPKGMHEDRHLRNLRVPHSMLLRVSKMSSKTEFEPAIEQLKELGSICDDYVMGKHPDGTDRKTRVYTLAKPDSQ